MYHTIDYMLTAGRITKEKHPSPPPKNEVARLVEKGFDNWRIGRAWSFYFRSRYERMAEEKAENKDLEFRPN